MTRVGIFVSTIFWGYTAAQAQQYVIDTYAGGAAPPITGLATGVAIGPAVALTTGKAGAIYFGTSSSLIFRLDPNGILTRVAGSGRRGYRGDGGPAINAQISVPAGLAVDAAGNLFIADSANNCIRKVFPNGIIVTVAGDGTTGFSGDGGPATAAQLSSPRSLAVDPAGALFIGDSGNSRIRKVAASGIITTVAGNGTRGSSGDGGPAVNAQLMSAVGLALDGAGNLFLTDDNRVRKVSPDGTITTVAGTGIWGFSGDGGPATAAQLAGPISLAVDSAGDLFIVANARIRQVSADGTITTVAGNGADGFSGDGGQASDATFLGLGAVAVDSTGNLFIADGGNRRIRKVSAAGTITTVAGNGGTYPCVNVGCPSSGDGSPAAAAQLATPVGIAADRAGNVFVAESSSGRVRRISPDGSIATVAGIGGKCNSLCAGIAVDRAGNLFIADLGRVRKLSPEGILSPSSSRDRRIRRYLIL